MALCTAQQGVDFLAALRINEQDAQLNTTALNRQAEEISDQLIEIFERQGYLEEDVNPLAVFDPAQLLLGEDLCASMLAQKLMETQAEAIEPRFLGIRNTQKTFTVATWEQLRLGKFYPIFNPAEYSGQMGGATSVITSRPSVGATSYATVTLVQYLSPGWVPDSPNQVSTDACNDWLDRKTIQVYAFALGQGYSLVNLTARQARLLGQIINTMVSGLVLQANSFADTKTQVSITAFEKMKEAQELLNNLRLGKYHQTFLS